MYEKLISFIIILSIFIVQGKAQKIDDKFILNQYKVYEKDFYLIPARQSFLEAEFLIKQDLQEMIETIRIYKITQELDLTEEQSVKFFPKLKEMRLAKQEFFDNQTKLNELLERYLQDANKFAKEIKAIISEMETNETKLREKEARIKKEIANILTPEQLAKFLLLQQKFNREMREMVEKAKDMRRELWHRKQPSRLRIY